MDEILSTEIIKIGSYSLTIEKIATAFLILLMVRVIELVFIKLMLNPYFKKREIDQGRRFAVRAIVKYTIYLVGLLYLINFMFGSLSALTIGSASLLVGVGFGLQQTFNDFVSGIILLIDRGAEVGDIVVIDDIVGKVNKIGLRTSEVYTRDRVSIIIPNSKLVSEKVTNWSHNQGPARFYIDIGVSYKSDIDHVEKTLLKCADENSEVLKEPNSTVQLVNFGDSSLDFRLYYFSDDFFFAEKLKSDLRKSLFKALAREKIEIPFPQRDVWFKNNDSKEQGI